MLQSTEPIDCQISSLQHMGLAPGKMPRQPPVRLLKLFIRRRLSPARERRFKGLTNRIANQLCRITGRPEKPPATGRRYGARQNRTIETEAMTNNPSALQSGDRVRVRSRQEIDASLNHWRQLRGCTFMPEMEQYCGTIQQVLKPVRRFVDERDLRVKRTHGLVLLEGTICRGTVAFGPCDRCCYLFWREEWLEKIG